MTAPLDVLCPVCGTWFHRKPGTRQLYDKELCRKIGSNRATVRRRSKEK